MRFTEQLINSLKYFEKSIIHKDFFNFLLWRIELKFLAYQKISLDLSSANAIEDLIEKSFKINGGLSEDFFCISIINYVDMYIKHNIKLHGVYVIRIKQMNSEELEEFNQGNSFNGLKTDDITSESYLDILESYKSEWENSTKELRFRLNEKLFLWR